MTEHSYDKEHDILSIKFRDDDYHVSQEYDNVVLDLNKNGGVIGIEIFNISKYLE